MDMPSPRAVTWSAVGRLALAVTAVSVVVVLGGGTALWVLEAGHPDGSLRSWGDAVWWALSTMTTVGYGDLVPLTTAGRLVAAVVMVVGVAVIGAVAAVVALTVARQVAHEEERAIEAEAGVLEQRLEAHLARMEDQLSRLDALLRASSAAVRADDGRDRPAPWRPGARGTGRLLSVVAEGVVPGATDTHRCPPPPTRGRP